MQINLRKGHLTVAVTAIVFLALGYAAGGGAVSLAPYLPLAQNTTEQPAGGGAVSLAPSASGGGAAAGPCKTFCEAIPNTQYGFVRNVQDSDHCFCTQELKAYDFDKEKTLIWTQAFDVGVITAARVEDSIPADVKAQREQQLQLQQQLLRQLQQQQTQQGGTQGG